MLSGTQSSRDGDGGTQSNRGGGSSSGKAKILTSYYLIK
jgi:hypothetical protein